MNPFPLSPVCTRGLNQLDHSANRTLQTPLIHQFLRNLPSHLFCLCLDRFYSQTQQMFAKHPLCPRRCFTIPTLSLTKPKVLLDKLCFSPLSHTVSVGWYVIGMSFKGIKIRRQNFSVSDMVYNSFVQSSICWKIFIVSQPSKSLSAEKAPLTSRSLAR